MEAEISESDLLGIVQNSTNPLHELQQAIAAMPAVDPDKVQAAINKLRSANLDILGTTEERLACAQRIAKQIIEETSGSN